jgi:hypothetical protein
MDALKDFIYDLFYKAIDNKVISIVVLSLVAG